MILRYKATVEIVYPFEFEGLISEGDLNQRLKGIDEEIDIMLKEGLRKFIFDDSTDVDVERVYLDISE